MTGEREAEERREQVRREREETIHNLKEEMRRNQEEERRKARPEPEDWRSARENNNLPPNQPQKVFNDQRNRPPPVHAAEPDWGALRTSDPPARPPVRQLQPSLENNNDSRLPPKLNKLPERDFANVRKEPRPIIQPQQPPMREEKDFGNLRARKIEGQPAPVSQSDQQDDWRKGLQPVRKNLENENKDPRSTLPPPRKIPYQPGGDRDFGNLRNNMQPRTGPPPKRNLNDDDWRGGADKRGRSFYWWTARQN